MLVLLELSTLVETIILSVTIEFIFYHDDVVVKYMPTDSVDDLILQLEDLQIREAALRQRIVVARAREAHEQEAQEQRVIFRPGDRVEITNLNEDTGLRHRRAVVTKVTDFRVHYRTDSGTHSNRKPSNLRHL